jgi:TolA-binding protein
MMALPNSWSHAMSSRIAACAALFVLSMLVIAHWAEPAAGQGKETKKDVIQLEKQLRSAQADLQQAQRQIASLKQEVTQLKGAKKKDEDKKLNSLQSTIDGYRGAGLVHVVVLKAKPETTDADVQNTIDESYAQLTKIKTVRGLWAGKPSSKSTPDMATDYTLALALVFDDAAGLKTYLNDPVHTKFTDKQLKKWEMPLVYDFEPRKPKP